MKGQDHEVAFWRNFLERRGREYEKARPLSSLFNFMIDGKDRVRIANLGAGAVSLIGEVWEGTEVEVVASDILANEYAAIRSELGINLYTPVEYEDMTDLLWKDNAFDIVFCANALDHCQRPRQAIAEMVRACKLGGWVYLRHIPHEGKRRGYKGLHQWNIDAYGDGDCEFWTRGRTQHFLLSECCAGFTTRIEPAGRASRVVSFVKKR